MNTFWKVVIIVFAVLVVLALVAMPFLVGFGRMGFGPGMMGRFGFHGRMMGGYGFPLFGLLRGLASLGLIALVVWAVFGLVRRSGVAQPPVHPAAVQPGAMPCPHCGKYIQSDWVACPYCGERTPSRAPVAPPPPPDNPVI